MILVEKRVGFNYNDYMETLNVDKLQHQLPVFVKKVEAGEEIMLEKSGTPIAKVTPINKRGKRVLGKERGKIWMSDDFMAPLPEDILSEFYK